jgi:Carboxypeptidase regulatory-like domain
MRKLLVSLTLFLSLVSFDNVFGQSTSATVSGTVADRSGAVLPGVSVTATNNGTAVASSVVTNEAGAYSVPGLLPGTYTVSAELPGFQKETFTNVQLGNADKVRLNFTLQVATQAQSVEVTVAADTLLATSSSSVGEVLNQSRVQDLPTVSNNVLDLYRLIPGVRVDASGVAPSFAGQSGYGSVNMMRDGVDIAGGSRWGSSALSATYLSPDLIGEARIVVSPVDAELGRGNAQIQFLTRSGTNQFHGTGVWAARNSAFDANTWNNNKQIDAKTGAWKPTIPDWANNHQFTGSLGGPIVKEKTFFFGLWDTLLVNGRTTPNSMVLTPCARNGIFRYFDGWNNGNINQVTAYGATPTIAVVDGLGNPVKPTINPTSATDTSPYTGSLHYFSVFGPGSFTGGAPDLTCSNFVPSGGSWDTNRVGMDPTGFVKKQLDKTPLPNNYDLAGTDGLNTAGYRWTRNENGGTESIFGTNTNGIAALNGLGRKQLNGKLDHNFNAKNKLGVSYTYERSSGNSNYETLPGGFRGSVFRHPQTLAINLTSTLTPTLVNEARAGMRRSGGNSFNGFTDPKNGKAAQAFYPSYNGYPVYLGLGAGTVNFQANGPLGGGVTAQYNDATVLTSYSDSLSWTKGKHGFKGGGELRFGHSLGYDAGISPTAIPRAVGGDTGFAPILAGAISTQNMPGLAGTTGTGNNQRMRSLLSFLAGSVSSVAQFYYMQDPKKLTAFEDYKTFPQRVRDTHQNEMSFFFKDDWKIRQSLTLNLGVRWDYYGVPYDRDGLFTLPDRAGGIWGVSGSGFADWFKPGVRGNVTTMQYIGKNSPNSGTPWFNNDYKDFGPAVGFAWQVPWFGEGKTTVRGGYQLTYNQGQAANSITQENVVPGATLAGTYAGDSTAANAYLDLTKVANQIPVIQIIKPLQPIPTTDRTQQVYNPQANLRNPYTENMTLSVTRSLSNNLTLDVRYIGTLGRRQWNSNFQINQPNFLYNGLKEAFDAARAGNDSSPALQVLETMFAGINLVGGTGSGPVGTSPNGVLQTAGAQLRASTATSVNVTGSNLQQNLANGNYENVAAILNTMNYTTTAAFPGNDKLAPIPAGVNGAVMRNSGKFPENFIVANPQFSSVFVISDINTNNYHSLEAQVTLRPTHGVSMQTTYTWSKNLGIFSSLGSTYTDPLDRHSDYGPLSDQRVHDFRTNGQFTLPVGPGKMLLGGSGGVLARLVEGWQAGWIFNANTGQPMTIVGNNTMYGTYTLGALAGNPMADIVGPFNRKGKVHWAQGATNGVFFSGSGGAALKQVKDPQCATLAPSLQSSCTLNAIADASTGQILIQNAQPGKRGNSGLRSIEAPGLWRFDSNLTKSFKVAEGKSLLFRIDATDLFNHPEPATPVLDINQPNFGQVAQTAPTPTTVVPAKSTLHRQFQASLRFTF